MQFASYVFLFYFLPGFLLLYAAIGPATKNFVDPRRARSFVIAVASYIFYGWWRPDFVWLMMVSSLVDFVAGIRIGKAKEQGGRGKVWLLLSLATNLGLLGYFKYANFGIAAFNDLAATIGIGGVENWSPVILPIGISFFTFQTMSYTIDVYRGVVDPLPVRRIVDFLCYVSMFPQLVAGPIIRYKELEVELRDRTHSLDLVYKGILLLQCGLAKKILIADPLHTVSEAAFSGQALGFVDAWTGAFAFTFQLYFDFSGYSDMAIGLGLMLGFHFPVNFNSPYKSDSITDFWRRWHISLSSWLRDYLYVPLGGNRKGPVRTAINLMITMLLGGFWHGANWTFVIWGFLHGLALAVERWLESRWDFVGDRFRLPVRVVRT
ncbi:MAG TPA: MBOAT family O-acyltransferase, partial [Planctomycetota bacterium]|nr:MBOAT family O-acyltransferase [Planctomycetota bacterium]